MSINPVSITAKVKETYQDALQEKSGVDEGSFEQALAEAKASGDTEKLREVSDQLEAVFINMMMKTMRQSIPETDGIFKKSEAEKMFQSMLDEEYANNLASAGGIGLSDMIFDQMEKYLYNEEDEKQASSFEMKG